MDSTPRLPEYALWFPASGAGPSTKSMSKYGGQPDWISRPQWPVVRETGEKMTFVMQIKLPREYRVGGHQMAYVFIEDDESAERYPCEAECGRNAVILQGGPAFEPHVMFSSDAVGPTIVPTGRKDARLMFPLEALAIIPGGKIVLEASDDADNGPGPGEADDDELDMDGENGEDDEEGERSKLGGAPDWLHEAEVPDNGPWVFMMQVVSDHVPCWVPYEGFLYVFVSPDGRRARMLYQFT